MPKAGTFLASSALNSPDFRLVPCGDDWSVVRIADMYPSLIL